MLEKNIRNIKKKLEYPNRHSLYTITNKYKLIIYDMQTNRRRTKFILLSAMNVLKLKSFKLWL